MGQETKRKKPEDLRSHRWFGVEDLRAFGHRSRMRQMGYDQDDWKGRPVIGIINTWSDINQCHAHLRDRAQDVKTGVLQAGGLPLELPAISLSEPMVKPTTMLYRNLLAMETEELLRSHPIDGAVLLGGCDKTTPGLLMGAISMGLPTIFCPAGPMLRGHWGGQVLGSGSDSWKYWDEKRAGNISEAQWAEIEGGIARSFGTCMTMGTAATMMAIAEAMGMTLPGASSMLAADSGHIRMCKSSGRRIVDMVWDDVTPDQIITSKAIENAIKVHMAMGGSTNAIIHVIAMARRAGIALSLEKFDQLGREVPVLANVRPSGKYLMEDFFYAGGLPALMSVMADLLDTGQMTVNGQTIGENIAEAKVYNDDVIRSRETAIYEGGATAVLTGNLAPGGCVIKPSAVEPRLREHRGAAIVFEDYNHMMAEIDRDDLDVTPGDARVGHAADPDEAREAGRARHAARFRRAHERDELWRVHPARLAREFHRGAAGAGPDRRRDRSERREAFDPPVHFG